MVGALAEVVIRGGRSGSGAVCGSAILGDPDLLTGGAVGHKNALDARRGAGHLLPGVPARIVGWGHGKRVRVVPDGIHEADPTQSGELAEEGERSDVAVRSAAGSEAARDDEGLRVDSPYRCGCHTQQVYVLSDIGSWLPAADDIGLVPDLPGVDAHGGIARGGRGCEQGERVGVCRGALCRCATRRPCPWRGVGKNREQGQVP